MPRPRCGRPAPSAPPRGAPSCHPPCAAPPSLALADARCWATGCTVCLWTTACCGTRQAGAGLGLLSCSQLVLRPPRRRAWSIPAAPLVLCTTLASQQACRQAQLACSLPYQVPPTAPNRLHPQEAERVMDTFNEHLHLPVTKVDDAGECTTVVNSELQDSCQHVSGYPCWALPACQLDLFPQPQPPSPALLPPPAQSACWGGSRG